MASSVGEAALNAAGDAILDIENASKANTLINIANTKAKIKKKGEDDAMQLFG